jgi:hypothetical protein
VRLGIEMALRSRLSAWAASKASLILAMMVDEPDVSSLALDRAHQAP